MPSKLTFLFWVVLAAFGPTRFLGFWVNIRCCGNGFLGFRPYGESLFSNAKKVTKNAGPRRSAPRFGSVFLRSGIHPGASPTVCFAAPPLDVFGFAKRSLRSHPRINPSTQPSDGAGTSKAVLELTLIVLSGGKPKQRRNVCFFKTRIHLGVSYRRTSPKQLGRSPLPWERARVRGWRPPYSPIFQTGQLNSPPAPPARLPLIS